MKVLYHDFKAYGFLHKIASNYPKKSIGFRFEFVWKNNVFTELLLSLREISLELAHALTKVFWCWLTTVKERFFSIKDQRVVAIYSVADTINFYYTTTTTYPYMIQNFYSCAKYGNAGKTNILRSPSSLCSQIWKKFLSPS